MNSDIQTAPCAKCGQKVAYQVRMEAGEPKYNVQHVAVNLECADPFPQGKDAIEDRWKDVKLEVSPLSMGMLIAVPPNPVEDKKPEEIWVEAAHRANLVVPTMPQWTEVQQFQLPAPVLENLNFPPGTRYYSVTGLVG